MSQALIDQLATATGPRGCLTEAADMAPYLDEQRGLYRGQALCVVRPATTEQAMAVVGVCAQAGRAMVPQGGNTGLCGGAVAERGAVVIATDRMIKIRDLDPLTMTMTVEAGCVLAQIQQAADAVGLLFPLSLGAEGSCRIGGNLSTNAGGINVLRYGNARDLTLGLEVVLPDGRLWSGLKTLRKDNTGYDLKHLFIGAEGTLGLITAASLRLFPKPRDIQTACVAVPSPKAALEVLALARHASGDCVTGCELVPRLGLELWQAHLRDAKDPFEHPHPWYLVLELSSGRSSGLLETLAEILTLAMERGSAQDAVIAQSQAQTRMFWRLREELPEAQKREGASIKHDVSVPTSKVPEFIDRATDAVTSMMPGIRPLPFGHLGDGNIHFNLTQPVGASGAEFLSHWDRFNHRVHDIAHDLGGSFSAEHGIGLLKKDEMIRLKPVVDMDIMRKIKAALDPGGLMNPGKILDLPG